MTQTVDILVERLNGLAPRIAFVLGSGLGTLVDGVEKAVRIPYGDLPDPVAKVLEGMMGEIQTLRTRLDDVDGKTPGSETESTDADDPCIGEAR